MERFTPEEFQQMASAQNVMYTPQEVLDAFVLMKQMEKRLGSAAPPTSSCTDVPAMYNYVITVFLTLLPMPGFASDNLYYNLWSTILDKFACSPHIAIRAHAAIIIPENFPDIDKVKEDRKQAFAARIPRLWKFLDEHAATWKRMPGMKEAENRRMYDEWLAKVEAWKLRFLSVYTQ